MKMLFTAVTLATSFVLAACGPEPAAPTPAAEVEAPAGTETGAAQEVEVGAPKIASDEAVYEFGAIKATDSIEHIFKIKNEGTADLHIERVQRT
ncbi:DUF1573 domain-containing protein [Enhygromyxa salina]|nr:DUF1573 domain-containing protein [Enhygromyxa salina]